MYIKEDKGEIKCTSSLLLFVHACAISTIQTTTKLEVDKLSPLYVKYGSLFSFWIRIKKFKKFNIKEGGGKRKCTSILCYCSFASVLSPISLGCVKRRLISGRHKNNSFFFSTLFCGQK